jgi:hypothetical protein
MVEIKKMVSNEDLKSEWNLTSAVLMQLDDLLKRSDELLVLMNDKEWVKEHPKSLITTCEIAHLCIRKVKPLIKDKKLREDLDQRLKNVAELASFIEANIERGEIISLEELKEDLDYIFDLVYELLQGRNLLWKSYSDLSAEENLKNAINKGK